MTLRGWKRIAKDSYKKKSEYVYVALDSETMKWYFNFGQARINYKFHDKKSDAVKDMKSYMRRH